MIIKTDNYTLIKYEDNVFGYIHRNVKKDERLALQAVLKQDGVFDITDILYLNVKMLEKKYVFTTNDMEISVTIPFKNFELNFHDTNKFKEVLCYINFYDNKTYLYHPSIEEDPYLYNFLKKFINKVKITRWEMKECGAL